MELPFDIDTFAARWPMPVHGAPSKPYVPSAMAASVTAALATAGAADDITWAAVAASFADDDRPCADGLLCAAAIGGVIDVTVDVTSGKVVVTASALHPNMDAVLSHPLFAAPSSDPGAPPPTVAQIPVVPAETAAVVGAACTEAAAASYAFSTSLLSAVEMVEAEPSAPGLEAASTTARDALTALRAQVGAAAAEPARKRSRDDSSAASPVRDGPASVSWDVVTALLPDTAVWTALLALAFGPAVSGAPAFTPQFVAVGHSEAVLASLRFSSPDGAAAVVYPSNDPWLEGQDRHPTFGAQKRAIIAPFLKEARRCADAAREEQRRRAKLEQERARFRAIHDHAADEGLYRFTTPDKALPPSMRRTARMFYLGGPDVMRDLVHLWHCLPKLYHNFFAGVSRSEFVDLYAVSRLPPTNTAALVAGGMTEEAAQAKTIVDQDYRAEEVVAEAVKQKLLDEVRPGRNEPVVLRVRPAGATFPNFVLGDPPTEEYAATPFRLIESDLVLLPHHAGADADDDEDSALSNLPPLLQPFHELFQHYGPNVLVDTVQVWDATQPRAEQNEQHYEKHRHQGDFLDNFVAATSAGRPTAEEPDGTTRRAVFRHCNLLLQELKLRSFFFERPHLGISTLDRMLALSIRSRRTAELSAIYFRARTANDAFGVTRAEKLLETVNLTAHCPDVMVPVTKGTDVFVPGMVSPTMDRLHAAVSTLPHNVHPPIAAARPTCDQASVCPDMCCGFQHPLVLLDGCQTPVPSNMFETTRGKVVTMRSGKGHLLMCPYSRDQCPNKEGCMFLHPVHRFSKYIILNGSFQQKLEGDRRYMLAPSTIPAGAFFAANSLVERWTQHWKLHCVRPAWLAAAAARKSQRLTLEKARGSTERKLHAMDYVAPTAPAIADMCRLTVTASCGAVPGDTEQMLQHLGHHATLWAATVKSPGSATVQFDGNDAAERVRAALPDEVQTTLTQGLRLSRRTVVLRGAVIDDLLGHSASKTSGDAVERLFSDIFSPFGQCFIETTRPGGLSFPRASAKGRGSAPVIEEARGVQATFVDRTNGEVDCLACVKGLQALLLSEWSCTITLKEDE